MSRHDSVRTEEEWDKIPRSDCAGNRFLLVAFRYAQNTLSAETEKITWRLSSGGTTKECPCDNEKLEKVGYIWVIPEEIWDGPLTNGQYTLTLIINGITARAIDFTLTEE